MVPLAVPTSAILAMIARYSPSLLFAQDGRGPLVYLLRATCIVHVGLRVSNMLPSSSLHGSRLLPRNLDRSHQMLAPMSLLLLLLVLSSATLRSGLIETSVILGAKLSPMPLALTVWGGLS